MGSVSSLLLAANAFAQGPSADAGAAPATTAAAADAGAAPAVPATPAAADAGAPTVTTSADASAAPTTAPAPTAPAAPTSQPSDLSPTTNGPITTAPTISFGSGDPATKKDEAKKDDKTEEEKKEPQTPIAGSTFFFQTGVSPNVFSPGMVQSPDVTVDSFALFQPRWAFNKDWQIRGRFAFNYEWTDNVNSSTTRKREPRFTDSLLSLAFRGIPTLAKIKTVVLVNAGLPTSPESQAKTMYVAPGIGVAFARPIEHVLGGDMSLALSVSYSHPLYHYTTPGYENNPPYARSCYGSGASASCDEQVSGLPNVSNSVTALANIGGEWGKFEPSVFMLLSNAWAYEPTSTSAGPYAVQPGNAPTSFRQSTFFGVELDYNFVPWMSGAIGYQMFRNVLDSDGKIGNPFYSIYQDSMRVYLGTSVSLDKLYTTLSGQPDTKAAKGDKKPYFSNF